MYYDDMKVDKKAMTIIITKDRYEQLRQKSYDLRISMSMLIDKALSRLFKNGEELKP